VLVALALSAGSRAQTVQHGLRVPAGFEVSEFADGRLANDIFCMTLDPHGRVVVSGPGYIRILVDDDGDGRADRAIEFASGPRDGAQGLCWDGDSLYFTGDGGLRCYRDTKGDGRADGPSELILPLHTGGEHNAHAVRRGPDGWLYILCGNLAGLKAEHGRAPTSPVREPVAGGVLRLSPDFKTCEVVADGFRNAYDMDFNADGELFTFDSDNERCVSLPWYEPTRFYHVLPGGHYGWRAPQLGEFWRLPPYFCDVVAPVATFGRGSPTGVVCYRHAQFPEHYRGGYFLLDWTFGRIYFAALKRSGASYMCAKELFLEAVGDNGFAPTSAVVHPKTGDLYIAMGGRGTRGAVYRIRYARGAGAFSAADVSRLRPKPRALEWQDSMARALPRQATGEAGADRLNDLQLLWRHRAHFSTSQLQQIVRGNWNHPDRAVRQAATALVASFATDDRLVLTRQASADSERITVWSGCWMSDPVGVADGASRLLASEAGQESRLAAVRLVQLALGGLTSPESRGTVWEGYTPRGVPSAGARQQATGRMRAAFPSGYADLDREISRTLAVLADDDPALVQRIASRLTFESDPVEDIHYLIVLARLCGPRTAPVTQRVARALLDLDEKLVRGRRHRDLNWPLRVAELHAELARKDAALNPALIADPGFGRPDHVLLTRCPGFNRRKAADVFLARAVQSDDYPWSADLVGLVGDLPERESLPALLAIWGKAGLDEAIVPILARHAEPADRPRLLEGLNSPNTDTIALCLGALEKLPGSADDATLLALVRALARLTDGPEHQPLRMRLCRYLRSLTRSETGNDSRRWIAWFRHARPALAAQLDGPDGVDVAAWAKRLASLDWTTGDPGRGQIVFTRASCATCHSGAAALGPDLHGVAGRFSRDDLFTAILQPSRDISPRYRTTLVATVDGKVYQGLVIYQAADGLLLQTGPSTTVRIGDGEIATRRVTNISLMPAGLLDKLADRDLADLYAYLRSLTKPTAP
jgi:putative membrane-bound dehydrogenase-like protein